VLGLVAVAAVAALLWLVLKDDGTTPVATPSATPVTSQPAQTSEAPPTTRSSTPTPTPTPTETPSPSPTADLSGDVATALSAFSDQVGVLERDGVLDKGAAKTLDQGVRSIEKALRAGDARQVSDETAKLTADYDKGVQDGTITPEAAAQLDPLLADLQGAVDAYAAA
jgi:serine/threonine-protein kinase